MKKSIFGSTLIVVVLLATIIFGLDSGLVYARRQQITISGSTTVLPIAQRAAEVFLSKNPDVSISVRGGGSGNGIASVIDNIAQIASASRFIKSDEIKKAVANGVYPVPHRIAMDGIAVVVHPKNSVEKLTIDQLKKVYTGRITNWKQVGGSDQIIVVISRDSSSGTYEVFQGLVLGDAKVTPDALIQASNGAVSDVVSRTPGAIGYVGIAYLSSNLKALRIGASDKTCIIPSIGAVQTGRYALARDLFMFTNGWPTGDVARFINFILSTEGQKIVKEEGFIPLR